MISLKSILDIIQKGAMQIDLYLLCNWLVFITKTESELGNIRMKRSNKLRRQRVSVGRATHSWSRSRWAACPRAGPGCWTSWPGWCWRPRSRSVGSPSWRPTRPRAPHGPAPEGTGAARVGPGRGSWGADWAWAAISGAACYNNKHVQFYS